MEKNEFTQLFCATIISDENDEDSKILWIVAKNFIDCVNKIEKKYSRPFYIDSINLVANEDNFDSDILIL